MPMPFAGIPASTRAPERPPRPPMAQGPDPDALPDVGKTGPESLPESPLTGAGVGRGLGQGLGGGIGGGTSVGPPGGSGPPGVAPPPFRGSAFMPPGFSGSTFPGGPPPNILTWLQQLFAGLGQGRPTPGPTWPQGR